MSTKIEAYSPTWVAVREHCTVRLSELRLKLEGDITWDETLKVRAQIKELKNLLGLVKTELPLVAEADELPG